MILGLVGFLLAYLMGSLPTAFIAGKIARSIDIREHGSGNVGATNVFRVLGAKWGSAVLVIDIAKSFLAVLICGPLIQEAWNTVPISVLLLLTGMSAIAGHIWTPFLRFAGGKGVASSLGVALAVMPLAAIISLTTFLIVFSWSRYVSLGSLLAALVFPIAVTLFYRSFPGFPIILGTSLFLCLLIVVKHRSNIARLMKGTESQVGRKKQ